MSINVLDCNQLTSIYLAKMKLFRSLRGHNNSDYLIGHLLHSMLLMALMSPMAVQDLIER